MFLERQTEKGLGSFFTEEGKKGKIFGRGVRGRNAFVCFLGFSGGDLGRGRANGISDIQRCYEPNYNYNYNYNFL